MRSWSGGGVTGQRHHHAGPARSRQSELLGGGQLVGQLVQTRREGGGVEPVLGIGRGRLTQHLGQWPQAVVAGELGADARHERRDGGVGGEGDHPGHRLVEDERQRIDVGPTVDAVAERLLGCGVAGRSHRRPRRLGQRSLGQSTGQAEVRHAEAAFFVEEEVGGLHVTVDEAAGVGVGEALGRLGSDRDRLGQAETRSLVEHVPQRPPAQEFEHQERSLGVLTPVVDGEHMGVGQRRRGLRLGAEPAQEAAVGSQRGVQDLDGHTTLQCRVERREHVRGRPAPEC